MNKYTICLNLLLISVFTLSTSASFSQQVSYFPSFSLNTANEAGLQLLGQIGTNYVIYRNHPEDKTELLFCNDKGEIIKRKSIPFVIQGLTTHVNIIATTNQIQFIFQDASNNKEYLKTCVLNADGEIISEVRCLDSTRLDLFGPKAIYHITSSEDKKKTLCYRIVRGFSDEQAYFNALLIDEKGSLSGSTLFYIPFNAEMETLGTPYLTNRGEFFLAVHDKASNFKLGSKLRLYQSSLQNNTPSITEIYFKENKPVEFMMDWWEEKQVLALGGLYYNFYSKSVGGAYSAYIKPGAQKLDSLFFNSMDKKFRKSLRNRIYDLSLDDVINSLQSRYFKVLPDGKTILLSDMFNNFTFSRSMMNNNPAASSFRNRPQGYTNTVQTVSPSGANLPTNTTTVRSINPDRASTGVVSGIANTTGGRNRQQQPNTTLPGPIPSGLTEKVPNANPLLIPSAVTAKDAGDVLILNRQMDYKSVFFFNDPDYTKNALTWARSLYVPGTPFTDVLILPADSGQIKLLNYEIGKKNMPYLNSTHFRENTISNSPAATPGQPLLFYKKNIVWWGKNRLLTLYEETETGRIGIAEVKWD